MLVAMNDGTTTPRGDDTHAAKPDYVVDTIARSKET